ncbi:MAG TPA: potassium channel protein [bacterium]|nr:potassium channel protein [bacterium]
MAKPFIIAFLLLVTVVIIGTVGYILIQGWSPFDALYMTVITIGTVGFREVGELTPTGKAFTIIIIIFGIGVGGYAIANFSAYIIEGFIQNFFKGKKMEKKISKLRNHIIVCGYGKTGDEIVNNLKNASKEFVLIENDEQKIAELKDEGLLVIQGDATEDEVLEKAGVRHAHGLITSLSHDADNVYVTLTARGQNPNIRIIARAVDESSSKKLLRAGANKVVSPYSIAGKRMAGLMLDPGIVDFLEVMVQSQELELKIEEIKLDASSSLINKLLRESNIKAETDGATVIGVKNPDGKIVVNPPGNTRLTQGIILYVLGNEAQISSMQQLAGSS